MIENTCCGGTVRLVASCSGRSNVGQIANRLMVEMERMGILKGFCITGVGAGLSGFVESAKAAELSSSTGAPQVAVRRCLRTTGWSRGAILS